MFGIIIIICETTKEVITAPFMYTNTPYLQIPISLILS